MPKPLDIEIPADILKSYVKWLRKPSGVCFGFCLMTVNGTLNVTLPWVKVKRG